MLVVATWCASRSTAHWFSLLAKCACAPSCFVSRDAAASLLTMADVIIERHPRIDPGWLSELVAGADELGLTARDASPEFLAKGPWDLVLLLAAFPSEA